MKYLNAIIIAIVIIAALVSGQQTRQQLEQRATQLEQLLEDAARVLRNNPNLNQNDLRLFNQQDANLKLLVIELEQARTQAQIQQVERRLIELENTVQGEITRLQAIINGGGSTTTTAPLNKAQLEQRASELEKLLEDALRVLREHPLVNVRDLVVLDAQDLALRILVEELEATTNPTQVAAIEGRLLAIENTVQSEVNRLTEIIRSGTTVGPSSAAPSTAAPVTSAPSTAAPVTAAPSTAAPSTAAPVTAAPSTAAPTTLAPVTAAPSTAAPSTAAPSTAAPSTAAPTTVAPSTVPPTPFPSIDDKAALLKKADELVDKANATSEALIDQGILFLTTQVDNLRDNVTKIQQKLKSVTEPEEVKAYEIELYYAEKSLALYLDEVVDLSNFYKEILKIAQDLDKKLDDKVKALGNDNPVSEALLKEKANLKSVADEFKAAINSVNDSTHVELILLNLIVIEERVAKEVSF